MIDPSIFSPGDQDAARDSASADPLTQRTSLRFLMGLLSGVLGSLATFYLVLFALLKTDNLPPPAFSNSLCIDDKLRFMRESPLASPDLLIIGSSVAWRHVDGELVAHRLGGVTPLNAGFCGLQVNQSAFVANWLLDQHPSIRQVVLLVAPQDFASCRKKPDAIFDREDATQFVFEGASRWPYYITYFSPTSLIRNARTVKDKRHNLAEFDPLVFTRFGDGPIKSQSPARGLLYGVPDPLDASCLAALNALSTGLNGGGRQLLVVATPIHPEWKAQFDPNGQVLSNFESSLRAQLAPTGGRFWNAAVEWTPEAASFTDALHLRWSAARDFSLALSQRMRP
jgi:hypothetical protein